jgi:hypothetical protein
MDGLRKKRTLPLLAAGLAASGAIFLGVSAGQNFERGAGRETDIEREAIALAEDISWGRRQMIERADGDPIEIRRRIDEFDELNSETILEAELLMDRTMEERAKRAVMPVPLPPVDIVPEDAEIRAIEGSFSEALKPAFADPDPVARRAAVDIVMEAQGAKIRRLAELRRSSHEERHRLLREARLEEPAREMPLRVGSPEEEELLKLRTSYSLGVRDILDRFAGALERRRRIDGYQAAQEKNLERIENLEGIVRAQIDVAKDASVPGMESGRLED